MQADWHTREGEDVLAALKTEAASGLTTAEAARRLADGGPNSLPQPPRDGLLLRFFKHFHNLLIYVLIASALITALLGHWVDTVVIAAVVVVNAIIGVVQEGKAEKAMDAIRHMLAPRAAVLRDGHRMSVAGEDLVPGDVVLLEAGDRVPADMRLLQCRGMSVQEAILTGESVAVEKSTQAVAADLPLGDREGMAYSGTLVATGSGRGVVVATGADTEIGHISAMLASVESLTTPLTRQMAVFSRWLTVFILGLAILVLAFGILVQGQAFGDLFTAVVGLSVAAIPEGLPTVLTVTLAIGVQTMARRRAIVRRLPAIETLGSVSVICSDKTGTLTRNEMMVASACVGDGEVAVDGEGYCPEGSLELPEGVTSETLSAIAHVAALCNDAALHNRDGQWQVEGDPMEGALLAFAGKLGVPVRAADRDWVRGDVIPFDTRHRFMATLDHDHAHHVFLHLKGAPETVFERCNGVRSLNGEVVAFDRAQWIARAETLAARGQRVLALASREMPEPTTTLAFDTVEGGLVLEGLVGLIDPPRPEAVRAVAACHRASIGVKMITGDHAGTAAAIGTQIGLERTERVLTGRDIDAMDDAALAGAVMETDVFARTSPEHKLRLVTALQAQGLVVAMTGDGVNDAPALKRADAGIAMGQGGSEAAKEASELVLLDDNFATIVGAVEAGRTVYDNLKKVITFLLPVNGGESLSLLLAILLGLTLPITAAQILWVNMVGSVALAMALAFEPTEINTLARPPRPPGTPILSAGLVLRIVLVSVLFSIGVFGQFWGALAQGADEATARTMAVNTLVVMEVFYLFSVRYQYGTSLSLTGVKGTPAVWTALVVVTVLQLAFTYLPWLARWFEARPLSVPQGTQVLLVGVAMLLVMELGKWAARRRATSGLADERADAEL
jgi:magnesium-transporting ATPase (P-type)